MGVPQPTTGVAPDAGRQQEQRVNDFAIVVATANGTGSQTSNLTILRALFKMGIPVNGKNIFPSNIQGLPTWYHIRVSKDGYVARRETSEVLVAFNQATVNQDVQELPSGGICLYNDDWRSMPERDDIVMYGIPVNEFLREVGARGKFRDRFTNMIYVGALAQLIGIELEAIEEALNYHFGGRQKIVEPNMEVIQLAYDWAAENLEKRDPFRVERMDETEGLFLITGNEAAALGAIFGGMTLTAWYPITPSTSVVDALTAHLPALRNDEEGNPTYVVVQAEDELAAIGMVVGAGWAGARAMTATSGPGISLMAEFAGLAYFAEIPAVIWDIQRVGPSTGLPTRTSQGDVTFAYHLGHGDTKNILLFPANPKECFEFGGTAFDLAEELQTLVLVLSDLDLGMNNWMTEPFDYPEEPLKRGKVLSADQVDRNWGRYKDVDGTGVGYRTLPGNEHPLSAYFTRGTGHDERAVYSEDPDKWVDNMARILRKFETARQIVPGPVVDEAGAAIGIIAYGTTEPAIEEARDRLAAEGVKTDFMRLRALPINDEVRNFVERHDRTYVVEMNRDGQMHGILQLEMPDIATKLLSLAYLDGMPLAARWIAESLHAMEKEITG
ncbi:MAG: 2-oxoacid:acceptor oxidoreductase subunit alpha [Candidatus Promineifilaceae bacterium]|nr:2-oxoacid:acceptor oxidoreductase subunit alpha [Candidatus Promineifilaceae bacterium]